MVSYPGLDGSRIDVAYVPGFAERIQLVDAGGVFVARARIETVVPSAQWALIIEHADGSVHTAETHRTRGGWLESSWGTFAERGTPDPTPLPLNA